MRYLLNDSFPDLNLWRYEGYKARCVDYALTAARDGTPVACVLEATGPYAAGTIATSRVLNAGTEDTALSNADVLDGTNYQISEVVGTPGLDVEITFTHNYAKIGKFRLFGYYGGNAGHTVNVNIYDFSTNSWTNLGTLPDATADAWYEFDISGDSNYISAGSSQIQIVHTSAGNVTHDLYIDYMEITDADSDVAYTFDGSTSYVGIYNTSLRDAFDGDVGSISIWVRVSGAGVWTDGGTDVAILLGAGNDNRIQITKVHPSTLQVVHRGSATAKIAAATGLSSTGWIHVGATWDYSVADELKLYIDGTQQGGTQTGLGNFTGTLDALWTYIASYNSVPAFTWNGDLAHVAVWTSVLSQTQISAIYNAATRAEAISIIRSTEAADLIGYWPLQERLIDGLKAYPGPGTRTVVDTDGDAIVIAGGNMVWSNLNSNWTSHAYHLDGISRATGRILLMKSTYAATNKYSQHGFDDNQVAGTLVNTEYFYFNQGSLYESGENVAYGTYSATTYQTLLVIRNTGYYRFIKGGAFTNWTLLWVDAIENTVTLYPAINSYNEALSVDYIRVPDDLWLPRPVVSDGFTDSNGTSLDAHDTDGEGHAEGVAGGLGTGGSGLSWTEDIELAGAGSGDFDIQGNEVRLVRVYSAPDANRSWAYVDSGDADVIVDCTVTTDSGLNSIPGILLRYTDTDNLWICDIVPNNNRILERATGSFTVRASGVFTVNFGTDYDLRVVAYGTTIDAYADGGSKITYGSASTSQSATKHGLGHGNQANNTTVYFDNFVVYPRGTGGEYDESLDQY